MALTADTVLVSVAGSEGVPVDIPLAANTVVYRGSAVGDNASGYARAFVVADPFLGFAISRGDNNPSGGSSAGDVSVRISEQGIAVLTVVGATGPSDRGEAVYATDENTFTLTSTSATQIGKVRKHISGTSCEVHYVSSQLYFP
jgi:hypothetical protein